MTFLDELVSRYPSLAAVRGQVDAAIHALVDCYGAGGKLLVCGNGGSAADADHIVGELMKGYLSPRRSRPLSRRSFARRTPSWAPSLGEKLQGALAAINISAISAFATAFGNDVAAELTFAQATSGYGRPGDVLMGISTSGNALNVRGALATARALGIRTIGLTGKGGGRMAGLCDILIAVPATRTFEVQELHLPVYHCICAMVEARFFP